MKNRQITRVVLAVMLFFSTVVQAQKSTSMQQKKGTLIYIMDPQCGWCYGNSENILQLKETLKDEVDFELLTGGMWVGENAPKGGVGFNNFIQQHSPTMERTTGAEVSAKFYELTKDETYTFSSLEASQAIVAVKNIAPEKAFAFAKCVQRIQFVDGKRFDKLESYIEIVEQLEIDTNDFVQRFQSPENLMETKHEFAIARQLASGFPMLVLKVGENYYGIISGYFKVSSTVKKVRAQLKD